MLRTITRTGIVLSFLLHFHIGNAQKPQFAYTYYPAPPGTSVGGYGFSQNNIGVKIQSIYYPTDLPGMPAGFVEAVYVRIGNNSFHALSTNYPAFTVKMGYTNDSTFPNGPGKYDTFKTGLTTVYGPATFVTTLVDTIGYWVKIPVNGTWSYSTERKFVVEIAMGPKNDTLSFDLMVINPGKRNKWRSMGDQRDSIRSYYGFRTISPMDIGFDIKSVGVSERSLISSAGIFPNPATGGHFNVSLEGTRALGMVHVEIINALGQSVLSQSYAGVSTAFFQSIDGSGLAPGIYQVTISAGGERIVRRVSIQ